MGRCKYRRVGYGMSKEEAFRNACDSAEEEYGWQDGYSGTINSSTHEDDKAKCVKKPKPAKSCSVEKAQNFTKKWETRYMAVNFHNQILLKARTQGEAIKETKILALKHNDRFGIEIIKRLVEGDPVIARVYPKKAVMGEWVFTGTARC